MKRKTTVKFGADGYEDEFDGLTEASELKVLPNFLPPPHMLIFKEKKRKVTMELDESIITFFKKQAKKLDVPYQKMIRNLLIHYMHGIQKLKN